MKRVVEPEWLDMLPSDDPGAMGSRRDIHRLNVLMGNAGILAGLLRPAARPVPPRMVELGAGDGRFILRLARNLSRYWPKAEVLLVDSRNVVTRETRAQFTALGWSLEIVTADVFEWLRRPMEQIADVIMTNLFLHQFNDVELSEMLQLAASRTKLFAACEPCRSRTSLAFSRMVGLIGCNPVTCHDAVASVRAGFAERELSDLWPARDQWRLQERNSRWFTHAFVAERVSKL